MNGTATTLTAVLIDPDDGSETVLGTVSAGADGILSIVSSADNYGPLLDEIVSSVNGKETIRVRVPGEGKFKITSERHERDDPGILDAVKQYLSHLYGVELRASAAGVDEEVADLE
jgi:hypothetical protein